jgi:hypothetical protein
MLGLRWVVCGNWALTPESHAQPATCPSQILFGVACPLCGATRAGLHLLSGDIVTAVQFNAGLVAFSIAMAVVLLQQQRDGTRGFVASMDADKT